YNPQITQKIKTKKYKNGKNPATTHHCDVASTATGPLTGIVAGSGALRTRTSLQFNHGKPTSNPDCPVSGDGNGGALNRALSAFGPCLWQAMTKNDNMQPNLDPLMLNTLISQAFQSMPFFPDPRIEDPAASLVFVTVEPQFHQTSSPSAPVEKNQSSPPGNITRKINKALDLLKRKSLPEMEGIAYVPLRTDSLLLDPVRAIKFSME
ncbi:hypothetical protein A4A49_56526, partial [Nicotiana attenuata]